MQGTEQFTRVIADYLNERAITDPLFAPNLQKPNKNIEECVNYILLEVKNSGCHGFADEEIFAMAVHYYDEDSIGKVDEIKANVVVNHHVELTAEEKAEQHRKALERYQDEEYRKLTARQQKKAVKQNNPTLLERTLFDM